MNLKFEPEELEKARSEVRSWTELLEDEKPQQEERRDPRLQPPPTIYKFRGAKADYSFLWLFLAMIGLLVPMQGIAPYSLWLFLGVFLALVIWVYIETVREA